MSKTSSEKYISLNALTKFKDENGKYHFQSDKEAVQEYIKTQIEPSMMKFSTLEEKLKYLVDNNYYDEEILNRYSKTFIREIYAIGKEYDFKFRNLMGAMKFYTSYGLRTDDKKYYLETFTERAIMNALFLANGSEDLAKKLVGDILSNRFQPATPTFLNAGKKRRGEYISCYLLRLEDNMESIARGVATSLQLSKRGGGVALCLTNLREGQAPIKGIKNQSSGVVPVMKLLEDTFSYANQLGQRQGAGAVYLSAHHPEILKFLDTKRENADEKIRIKSLSLGVVIPDITFQLAQKGEDMALFSPYDIYKVYGKPMTDISITKEYENLLRNDKVRKTYINARKFFQTLAEIQFESGYPYILYEDTVNERNPHKKAGRIVMSNLCSEIAQVSTASTYTEDMSYYHVGQDICCNLGSINIAEAMKDGKNFGEMIGRAVEALDRVSRASDLNCAPSIKRGNEENHAIGLGAMNLHGFLATHHIYYDTPEAVDFTDMFFYATAYYAFKASHYMAMKKGAFTGFANSEYADGSYFKKYTEELNVPKTERVKELFEKYNFYIPTQEDWKVLVEDIKKNGLANAHLLAVAPTGSISYLSSCTPSLQPVVSPVEVRKEGKLGRVYVPAYEIDDENYKYYEKGAYEVGPDAIIDVAAAAQKHVDQAIAMTLFVTSQATTRDLNRAYIRAFKKKCSSIYYVRIRQDVLEGSEKFEEDSIIKNESKEVRNCDGSEECQTCMI